MNEIPPTPFERVSGLELLRHGMSIDALCSLLVSRLGDCVGMDSEVDPSGMDDTTYWDLRAQEAEAAREEAAQAASDLCKAAERLEASGVGGLDALTVLHAFSGERYRYTAEYWFELEPRHDLEEERAQRVQLESRLKEVETQRDRLKAELDELRACC
jgi:hypothetical protein